MSAEDQQTLPYDISQKEFTEVLSALRSIPRSDQRRWGELYVRGLLAVRGKKTMRALANGAGSGAEQSLYQFISKSPWNVDPVRGDLARLLIERAQPRAWVVQPLVIPKVGQHSVGVERQWVSQIGRVVNCQQAMSVWLAWDRGSCPVDWQLALPECWTDQEDMRRRASIPTHVGSCPPEQCAVDSVSKMSREWGLRGRPVVMDLRETAPHPVCADLVARQIPFVVRVDPSSITPSPPGPRPASGPIDRAEEWVGSAGLLSLLHKQRMPVEWFDHATETMRATSVGAARVALRKGSVAQGLSERLDLVLLAAWTDPGRRSPSEFWLSNLAQSQLGTVYRTAMLSRRVERDLEEVGDALGIRDFEGRSYRGWHHHMTMVSLAHAVTVLSPSRAQDPFPPTERLPLAPARGTKVSAA
ncbi:transposase (plasmid) [Streptomyces sp. NBC_01387]|uniref:IS701 family transposase n=1 Tax=unclassified Streptomyces TaxID=2593676 RepID=UPI0022505106|nr:MULTISPECIES: transposase [unclassified Streptomyces]MCX4554508.1 transposase [Streptomyces sp. NBC_01500]WSC25109.1 transposase [Streptomyces sp. NBC_01766]WSV59010.1 transposase [Streptomyces sp. NBC_01014]